MNARWCVVLQTWFRSASCVLLSQNGFGILRKSDLPFVSMMKENEHD